MTKDLKKTLKTTSNLFCIVLFSHRFFPVPPIFSSFDYVALSILDLLPTFNQTPSSTQSQISALLRKITIKNRILIDKSTKKSSLKVL